MGFNREYEHRLAVSCLLFLIKTYMKIKETKIDNSKREKMLFQIFWAISPKCVVSEDRGKENYWTLLHNHITQKQIMFTQK